MDSTIDGGSRRRQPTNTQPRMPNFTLPRFDEMSAYQLEAADRNRGTDLRYASMCQLVERLVDHDLKKMIAQYHEYLVGVTDPKLREELAQRCVKAKENGGDQKLAAYLEYLEERIVCERARRRELNKENTVFLAREAAVTARLAEAPRNNARANTSPSSQRSDTLPNTTDTGSIALPDSPATSSVVVRRRAVAPTARSTRTVSTIEMGTEAYRATRRHDTMTAFSPYPPQSHTNRQLLPLTQSRAVEPGRQSSSNPTIRNRPRTSDAPSNEPLINSGYHPTVSDDTRPRHNIQLPVSVASSPPLKSSIHPEGRPRRTFSESSSMTAARVLEDHDAFEAQYSGAMSHDRGTNVVAASMFSANTNLEMETDHIMPRNIQSRNIERLPQVGMAESGTETLPAHVSRAKNAITSSSRRAASSSSTSGNVSKSQNTRRDNMYGGVKKNDRGVFDAAKAGITGGISRLMADIDDGYSTETVSKGYR